MKREAFIRELQDRVKGSSKPLEIDKRAGKGSHYRLRWDGKQTICKSGDLSPVYMKLITKQLGIE